MNALKFENPIKYPIHIQIIELDLKSKNLDLNIKSIHSNGLKVIFWI